MCIRVRLWSARILLVLVIGFSKRLSRLFVNSKVVLCIVGTYFLIVSVGYILNTVTNCYLGALYRKTIKKYISDDFLLYCRSDAFGLSTISFRFWPKWHLVCSVMSDIAASITAVYIEKNYLSVSNNIL